MADTLTNRVRRGARLLDELLGRTALRRVSIRQLRMDTCDKCVLGQIFGDYVAGTVVLGIDRFLDAARLGFMLGGAPIDCAARDPAWDRLGELWADEIRARRG